MENQKTPKETPKRKMAEGMKEPWRPGQSGNPTGRPKGSRNFSTLFDEAIKKIVEEQRIKIDNPEREMIVKAVVEALKGNYSYYRDLMDRRFGKPREQFDISSGGEPMGVIFLPRRKKDENKQNEQNEQLDTPKETGDSSNQRG